MQADTFVRELNNVIRDLENQVHWLLALSLVNLLSTLAVLVRVGKLAKKG